MADYESQVTKILQKTQIKKTANINVIKWLEENGHTKRAQNITECATQLGITNIEGIARIVRANFCRERLCSVCAWRRQARFVTQTQPILNILSERGYEFIFVTLTIKNMEYSKLNYSIDRLMQGFNKLMKRRKITRAWRGVMRSVELTYNAEKDNFHPHIHLLVAVEKDYFYNNEKYITLDELSLIWKECINTPYIPSCDMRKVDNTERATLETFKYALKPSQHEKALSAFLYVLSGRRLISFSGVFAKIRTELKLADFETVLTDDIPENKNITFSLYKFDVNGGIYKFYNTYDLKG